MRSPADKKATTIRLGAVTKTKLENVARITQKSESAIVEQALDEFFKTHGYNTRYVMGASATCYVLFRQDGENITLLDQQVRNGVPLEAVRDAYAARFNSPVELLVEGETK